MACGRSFTCPTCKRVFNALENLQTHCRRKSHQIPLEFLSLATRSKKNKVEDKRAGEAPLPSAGIMEGNFVRIAPKQSLTMTAAIALSELSSASKEMSSLQQQQEASKNSVVSCDKPLWSASTQTSPRRESETTSDETILEDGTTNNKKAIPKLGEIEQFSTETQTDDLEILPPSAAAVAAAATSVADADAFTIEAQTQFDLEDILCSNYTQTVLFDSLDQTSSSAAVNSIETQTVFMGSDDLVHMETQTISMLFEEQ
jgi:hypothetical protein